MPAQHRTSHWTIGRARCSLVVALAAIIAGTAACGSDSPTGPRAPSTPVGSYTIQTINGKPLPVAIFADTNYTYEVTSGALSLGGDGKYSIVTTFRQTIPGNVSIFVDSSGGAWLQTGSTIQLTSAPPDTSKDSATWSNGLLTFLEVLGKTSATYVYYQAR